MRDRKRAWCAPTTQQCVQAASDPKATQSAIRVQKQADGTWTYNGQQCVEPLAPAKPAVTTADVRAHVVRLVPTAAIGLAPRTTTLVNIQTIMWVDAPRRRQLAAVQILGRHVDITLRIAGVDWAYGDGDTAVTTGPGTPYRPATDPCRTRLCPGYDGHIYQRTGTVHLTAVARWTATFTVDGGPAQQIPGTVAGPASAADLTVDQARSVLVPN